jgi:excisionase family DNA binding protein
MSRTATTARKRATTRSAAPRHPRPEPAPGTIGADLLLGVDAIAEHLGVSKRTALHLSRTRRLPVFRLGRTVAARKSELDLALRATPPVAE